MCQWHAVVNAVESSQVHSALQSSIFIGCVHLFVTKTQILNQIIERFRPNRKTKTKSTNLHWTMNVHVLYWCRLFLHHVSAVFISRVLKPLERVKVQIHFCCHDIVFFNKKSHTLDYAAWRCIIMQRLYSMIIYHDWTCCSISSPFFFCQLKIVQCTVNRSVVNGYHWLYLCIEAYIF